MRELLEAINGFNAATTQEHFNWHPGLGLELAFSSYLAQPEPELGAPRVDVDLVKVAKPSLTAAENLKASKEKVEDTTPAPQITPVPKAEKLDKRTLVNDLVTHEAAEPETVANAVTSTASLQDAGGISFSDIQKLAEN